MFQPFVTFLTCISLGEPYCFVPSCSLPCLLTLLLHFPHLFFPFSSCVTFFFLFSFNLSRAHSYTCLCLILCNNGSCRCPTRLMDPFNLVFPFPLVHFPLPPRIHHWYYCSHWCRCHHNHRGNKSSLRNMWRPESMGSVFQGVHCIVSLEWSGSWVMDCCSGVREARKVWDESKKRQ